MNFEKNDLLKNFTWGFVPILIFLVADSFLGPEAGIAIALLFGIGELVFFYIKDKRLEKFILFDIGLLILFGAVSLVLKNEVFFKLKPAVLEFILVVILGIHGFTNKPLLLMMGRRYFGNSQFAPQQLIALRVMTRLLFFILLAHTLLIIWAAYFWSREWWAFISGGFFYVIMGFVFAGQWIYLKNKKGKPNIPYPSPGRGLEQEEWFDLVDENGKILGRAPRSKVHGNPALLHMTVHIHIFNKQGRLFLQKRSASKDLFPGRWDTAVGGHVSSGEAIASALLREAREELGIDSSEAKPLFRYVMRNQFESELVHAFRLTHNGPFDLHPDEIEAGRFWTIFEIKKMLGKDIFTPNFEQEFSAMEKMGLI